MSSAEVAAGFAAAGFAAAAFVAAGFAAAGFAPAGFPATGFVAPGFATAGFATAFAPGVEAPLAAFAFGPVARCVAGGPTRVSVGALLTDPLRELLAAWPF